ncbi:MAG TPA: N-acetylmuramoyl-L-alanine amidase [Nitrospiria bacterium]
MEPYQPSQKGCAARWILIFLLGWTVLSPDSPSLAGRSPEQQFQSGKACQDRLHGSAKRQKLRHNWETCIKQFDALLTQHPNNRIEEAALLRLGELYSGLYRNSKNRDDIEKAQEYYHRLVERYPEGLVAKTARTHLKNIERTLPRLPSITVQSIRHWAYPDYTRLVLDMDREVRFRQSSTASNQITITLDRTRLGTKAQTELSSLDNGLLQNIAVKQDNADTLTLKISLDRLAQPPKILPLSNPDRLVIDLFGRNQAGGPNPPRASDESVQKTSGGSAAFAGGPPLDVRTIVIDPGHGGKDPGAIGRTGLTEKDIVLDIGLRLRSLVQERLDKKVIMTRDDDTFIPLDDRTLIANSKNADLFVSIHVNSHPQRATRGVEIYHLGQSSDRRAMAVAARENNVSLKSLGNLERSVKQILFDLGREYNIDQSQTLAHVTRRSFQTTLENRYDYDVVDHGVKRAPFYVLLNSNMPSILAEVSFISNPTEEQLLRQGPYRQAIAESLFQGIRAYLSTLKPVS